MSTGVKNVCQAKTHGPASPVGGSDICEPQAMVKSVKLVPYYSMGQFQWREAAVFAGAGAFGREAGALTSCAAPVLLLRDLCISRRGGCEAPLGRY